MFRRGTKWQSGWRDERGRCHSRTQPLGVAKSVAEEYARRMAFEACQIRAGLPVDGKDIRVALREFLGRQDVKENTHALNQRHLETLIGHFKLQTVDQLTESLTHEWLKHFKGNGCNPGGQSLCLRILRTFCRFCLKKRWMTIYPFQDFKIPKSEFVGRYLADEERAKLLSVDPRFDVDKHLSRALTFGLYSLLRISQVFHADWSHFKAPDQLWIPGIKGQQGRWITLHPKAIEVMGIQGASGQIFDRWDTLDAFREAVYKKAKREGLRGVRFHETKHTGISALLESGYSIPEVSRISGNSFRTIANYAHVNEQRVFEKWKSFEYGASATAAQKRTALIQRKVEKQGAKRVPESSGGLQGENEKRIQFATNS